MESKNFMVTQELAGTRIDKAVGEITEDISRNAVAKLIETENITVNGKPTNKKYKLCNGDVIEINIPDPEPLEAQPQNIPIDIVYEDDSLLVVNKPKGMVVHPAAGNLDGTLVNALLWHCKGRLSSINGVVRPGIVHRIDKNTSGLLMVAKTDEAHNFLAQQIKDHSFTRVYNALVVGHFNPEEGTIDEPIGRSNYDRKKMCVTQKNSKPAVTHYKTLENFGNLSLVEFKLETGRTHQIRVHSAYKGHAVYGDDVYGKAVKGLQGQCLHAKKLGFIHPKTGQYMEFDSDLPEYFNQIMRKL